jgi:hypothetical protein
MPIAINGSGTITGISAGGLPDATITQAELATGVGGTGPTFSAYQSSAQTISAATLTKVQLQTEEFDIANCFDSATNYRFTPNVAGYYQINGTISTGSAGVNNVVTIYKNGSEFKRGNQINYSGAAPTQAVVSALVYLNGSTDYVELYVYTGGGAALLATNYQTYFQGSMVRGA